jgi:hypothetical protein
MRVQLRAVRLRQRTARRTFFARLRLPLLLGAMALPGCNDLGVCGSHAEEVRQADGTAYRCIQAEDCPRASRVFVCTTDVSSERECVKCADAVCVRVIPEPCE